MAAGSIVVDLLLKTGSFETDAARAEKRLKAFQKQVEAVGTAIGVGLAAAAGLAVVAFESLVNAAGHLKDLEEQVGASAESLGTLSIAARVVGVDVSDLAGLMNKLTKNLSGVDDESAAAGAALSALGIPIEEFKKLDPVQQIDALTKAFGGFADGSQKTAVALALFGKAGAQMLSIFKELEAQGGRQVILTQAQIDLADEYTDKQKRLTAQIKAYAEAGATDLLPALNNLTAAAKEVAAEFFGIDAAGKKLASESPVKAWADNIADALAFAVDAGQGIARVFQTLGIYIGGTAAATAAVLRLEFTQAKNIAAEARGEMEQILSAQLFSQRLDRLRAAANAATDPTNQSGAETARLGRKPTLDFNGAQKSKAAKDAVTEAQRYLESLQKQVEKTQDLSAYEQALADIQNKRLKGINPQLEAQILAEAKLLDQIKAQKQAREDQLAMNARIQKAQQDSLDAVVKANDETRREIDLLGLDEEQKRALELQTIRVTRADKERALELKALEGLSDTQQQNLQAEIDKLKEREDLLSQRNDKASDLAAQTAAKKAGDAYQDALGNSIEQGILDGFRRGGSLTDIFINELKAQFAKTILRPIIQPAVDSTNSAIADLFRGVSGLFNSNTGYGINPTGTSLPTAGGAASGTNFVERDMLTILHKGEAVVPKAYNPASGGSGKSTVINIANHGQPVTAREESRQDTDQATIVNLVLDAVANDVNRGGRTHKAIAGQYGLSRAAGAPKRA